MVYLPFAKREDAFKRCYHAAARGEADHYHDDQCALPPAGVPAGGPDRVLTGRAGRINALLFSCPVSDLKVSFYSSVAFCNAEYAGTIWLTILDTCGDCSAIASIFAGSFAV